MATGWWLLRPFNASFNARPFNARDKGHTTETRCKLGVIQVLPGRLPRLSSTLIIRGTALAIIHTNVRLAAVFLLSMPVSAAIGLDGARPGTTHFEAVAQKEENANPPEIERLIAALTGEWTTEDTYEASASGPRLGHGREDYRAGPARLSLLEDYHGEEGTVKPWSTGIFWWDGKARGVHVLWCDSDGLHRGCRVLSGLGKWEGSDFVQTDVNDASGKRIYGREVWSDFKHDSFTQTVYQGATADKLQKILTIRATRKH
jgi:hypothetical protein